MTGYESDAPLAISQVDHRWWQTVAPLIFHANTGEVVDVPIGTRTDLASVPGVFTWLIPRLIGVPAAVVHDHAWDLAKTGQMTYRDADRILYEALGALGDDPHAQGREGHKPVGPVTQLLVWAAVRWASILTRRGGRRGALRDLPALTAVTVPGLILAAPAALLIVPICLLAALDHIVAALTRRNP